MTEKICSKSLDVGEIPLEYLIAFTKDFKNQLLKT